MVGQRSRFPLFLVLLLAAGLFVGGWWRNVSPAVSIPGGVPPDGGKPGQTGGDFGQLPLAAAVGEATAGPPPQDPPGDSEAMKLLAARMSRETGGLEVVEHADGRRSVSLDGGFHHMSAMVTGADGKREIRCFTDFNEMAAALPDVRPVNPAPLPIHDR
jgi:hypothetical protein